MQCPITFSIYIGKMNSLLRDRLEKVLWYFAVKLIPTVHKKFFDHRENSGTMECPITSNFYLEKVVINFIDYRYLVVQ